MVSWHVDPAAARQYADRRLDPVRAASVEAHLAMCVPCRTLVGSAVDAPLLAEVWAGVVADIDRPPTPRLVRVLRRFGVSESTARLSLGTTQARWSFLMAVSISLAFATVAAGSSRDEAFGAFLVISPMGPLAATVAAFGRFADPAQSIVATTPLSWLRVFFARMTTSVVPAVALTLVASIWLREKGWLATAWLLPSLALALGTLALATWTSFERAALAIGLCWLLPFAVLRAQGSEVLEVFGLPAQGAAVVVAVVAALLAITRRDQFDYQER